MIPLRDRNPSGSCPLVTLAIIAGCTVTFFFELSTPSLQQLFASYALIPARVTLGLESGAGPLGPLGVLTLFILHVPPRRLAPSDREHVVPLGLRRQRRGRAGAGSVPLFYFLCGIAAGVTHVLVSPGSAVPTVGASGAIAGVLAGYASLFPARGCSPSFRSSSTFRSSSSAVVLLVLWFVMQALTGVLSLGAPGAGGVAWGAHVGGFLAGLVLVRILKPRKVMA
jgi:membrane associated rhomboid family serine protease